MAIEKTIEINVNASAAQKALDDLGGSFEDVYGEAKPLSSVIGELEDRLYDMALAGDTSSDEFKKITKEVGNMRKNIIETDLKIDAMSTTLNQKVGGALGGVTAAFSLGAGVMGTFGVESEKVQEVLLRVQSAMAIQEGVRGIKEAIPSFKALGGAVATLATKQGLMTAATNAQAIAQGALNVIMNLNPVFLLITAFAALAGAFAFFTADTEEAKEANEQLNNELQREGELLDQISAKSKKAGEQRLRSLLLEGATDKEIHDQKIANLTEEEKARLAQMELEKNTIKEKKKIYKQALKEEDHELARTIKSEIKKSKERYRKLELQNGDYLLSIGEERKKFREAEARAEAEALAEAKATDEEKKRLRIEAYKRRQKEREEEAKRIAEIRRVGLEDIPDAISSDIQQPANLPPPAYINENEREVEAEKFKNENLLRLKIKFRESLLHLANNFEAKTEDLKNEWRKKDEESEAEHTQRKIGIADRYAQKTMEGLQSISALNDALTDLAVAKAGDNEKEAEKARRKGFERSKKIQIAMAIVQGVQSVMAAYTAGSSMGPAGVVMGPLMAAVAGVTAVANIAKIKAQKYDGGGSAGIGSAPQPVSVPASFNVVGDSGTNQIAEGIGQQNNTPVKAFVVSKDVTTQQELDRNTVETATFG